MAAGAGYEDAEGVWMFGEDDQQALFSDTLNIGQEHTSLALYALRDRIANLESIVGADGSAYTPTVGGITNGSKSFRYGQIGEGGRVWVSGQFTLSGSAVTGPLTFTLPNGVGVNGNFSTRLGSGFIVDVVTGTIYDIIVRRFDATRAVAEVVNTSGPYAAFSGIAPTVPFSWTNGCVIIVEFEFIPA